MRARLMMFLIASLTLASCKKSEKPTSTAPVVTEPTPPTASTLNDAQIAAIVVTANQVDIDAGNLAIKKAKNPEVKKFAERMVTDHTAVNKAAVDLVTKLNVTPQESDAAKSLA